MPKVVTDEIDSMCGKFLQKSNYEAQASAKVSWKSCCNEKKEGGFGLRNLTVWNSALKVDLHFVLWVSLFICEVLKRNLNNLWVINIKKKTLLTNEEDDPIEVLSLPLD